MGGFPITDIRLSAIAIDTFVSCEGAANVQRITLPIERSLQGPPFELGQPGSFFKEQPLHRQAP
jgi:hypothetical protein